MKKSLKFIALDLETTGLDPHSDTIIEIAAIKFSLDFDGENFHISDTNERTMLIHPWRPLEEEVTLITHITNSMLDGKPLWSDIQQKVADFIENDAIILGHNVFFDIAMLKTHGIDLTTHRVLDTFELSEILSQNSESLNLGFLADFYHIQKRGAEHRALTDTWISVDLFVKYLEIIKNLDEIKNAIFQNFVYRDHSPLSFLGHFFTQNEKNSDKIYHFFNTLATTTQEDSTEKCDENHENSHSEVFSLEKNSEKEFLKKMLDHHKKLHIVTVNTKSSECIQKIFHNSPYSLVLRQQFYHFIDSDAVLSQISENIVQERKHFLFLIKLMFWLTDTKTGLASELKYYGDEFDWLENFRLQKNETNIFRENHEKTLSEADIVIEVFHKNLQKNPERKTIFRDVVLLENTIRKAWIIKISFDALIKNLENFENPHTNALIHALRTIEGVYASVPNRPMGENPIPPWKYGETYFVPQTTLWCRGFKWLSMANRELFEAFENFKKTVTPKNRHENILLKKIITEITELFLFHTNKTPNIGVIITIIQEKISVQLIAKNLTPHEKSLFHDTISYGFHIQTESIEKFLQTELWLHSPQIFGEKITQITRFEPISQALTGEKILILTTNMKHIRELGASLDGERYEVLMQGISGGKSKMKHYFLQENEKKSILIGLIDTWRDDSMILWNSDSIIIAKIPFDPPTDPHFLAKTIEMSNSFENYSQPIVLWRLNSLIGNAKSLNPNVNIFCVDNRIHTTEWGKFLKKNLF